MFDIVVPYKRSNSNELLYMLRSIKNLPHRDVYIIGDDPYLQNITYIPSRQTRNIAKNTLNIIDIAANHPDISDNFILMHDDMFVMEPIKEIPVHYRGTYAEIIAKNKKAGVDNLYTQRMEFTYDHLKKWGIKEPLCYEMHIPFVISKRWWNFFRPMITEKVNKLSTYGNLARIGGTQAEDVKVRKSKRIPDGPFISTYDVTFGATPASRLVIETFKEKSIYERDEDDEL